MSKGKRGSKLGMNKFQKKARKKGEIRVRGEEVPHYLALAASDDPKDRLVAAANLCPCHIRHPVPEVQTALFALMEDKDAEVRARARILWHTLEDGGVPEDPRMEEIFQRAREGETDKRVLGFLKALQKENLQHKERTMLKIAARPAFDQKGKCDFCGDTGPVKTDYDTEIPHEGHIRFARVCEGCA
jgi:hypothetical protein